MASREPLNGEESPGSLKWTEDGGAENIIHERERIRESECKTVSFLLFFQVEKKVTEIFPRSKESLIGICPRNIRIENDKVV